MKFIGLLIILFFALNKIWGQELIYNGGFEELDNVLDLPDNFGQYYNCAGWNEFNWIEPHKFGFGSADYYHDSSEFNLSKVKNYFTKTSTFNGVATMGIGAYSVSLKNYHEYLATEFITPMENGGVYEVSFWITNGEIISDSTFAGIACNGLGIAFTSDKFKTKGDAPFINFKPQLLFNEELWNENWKKYSIRFISNSNFKYLTFGFFLNDSVMQKTDHKYPIFGDSANGGYYFLDDISVYRLPNIFGDTVICQGDTGMLKAYNYDSIYRWTELSDTGIVIGNSNILAVSPLYTTTYVLNPGVNEQRFTVRVVPDKIELLGLDTTICHGDGVSISIPSNLSNFQWQDGSSENKVILKEAGLYWIEVYDSQCISSDTITLSTRLCECEAIIPNSFTPNSDNLNDEFLPRFSCPVFNYKMEIFNQWGSLVFESASENTGWDGKISDYGLMSGNFIFNLKYELADGSKHELKGKLTLLK